MRMATERNDLVARLAEAKEEYERVTQERGEADERMDADRKMISEIEKEVIPPLSVIIHTVTSVLTGFVRSQRLSLTTRKRLGKL